jgi:hypothetical protein
MSEPENAALDKVVGDLEKTKARLVFVARWVAMLTFALMFLWGFCWWPGDTHISARGKEPLCCDDFEAIAKCLTGLVGMVLVDISMSLATIKRGGCTAPPKSPN